MKYVTLEDEPLKHIIFLRFASNIIQDSEEHNYWLI